MSEKELLSIPNFQYYVMTLVAISQDPIMLHGIICTVLTDGINAFITCFELDCNALNVLLYLCVITIILNANANKPLSAKAGIPNANTRFIY